MVFVWIPKTAGTSLFTALEQQVGMVNLCESPRYLKAFRNRGAVTFGHYDYQALLDAGFVSRDFHDRAYKFCVVRDPYDRALSLYFYLRRKKRRRNLNFLQFLENVRRDRAPIGMYNYRGLSQTNPQVDWIVDEAGHFIVDKIYRFEEIGQIERDFREMFDLPEFRVGHENKVHRDRTSAQMFSSHSEIMPLIEEIYARDFSILGYEKKAPVESR